MTLIQSNYIVLFAYCKIVKGKDKNILCDLQKGKIKYIPQAMITVITLLQSQPYLEVKEYFKAEETIFLSYVTFLLQEKFAFQSELAASHFPDLENSWSSPEIINNAIVEYSFTHYNLKSLFVQLDDLLTKFIELRLTVCRENNLNELVDVLEYCSQSVCCSLQIMLPSCAPTYCSKIINTLDQFPIVNRIVFYSSEAKHTVNREKHTVYFIPESLEDITKATIASTVLINNIAYYHECQNHNPYYNKKVAITAKGQIKNCIKNKKVFGSLSKQPLKQVVNSDEFQEFWYVTPDQIIDIQDSELRYNYLITHDMKRRADGKYQLIV